MMSVASGACDPPGGVGCKVQRGRGCILAVAVLLFLIQHSAETLRQAQAKAKENIFFCGGDGGELELEAILQFCSYIHHKRPDPITKHKANKSWENGGLQGKSYYNYSMTYYTHMQQR